MNGIRYYEFEEVRERLCKSNADQVEKMALLAIIDGDDAMCQKMTEILYKRKRRSMLKLVKTD